MFKMFGQLFQSFTVLFQGIELLATAVLHLCTTAERKAKVYADEAQLETEAAHRKLLEQQASKS